MNLQEELKALKERIAEIEEQVKGEQDLPQDGDEYCYVGVNGRIFFSEWDGFASEKDMLEIGNVFRTKEDAEFAVEKLKVEAELRKFSQHPNIGAGKWLIVCDDSGNVYTSYTNQGIFQGTIYFESEEKIRQALESVGEDRIKKYIFGVED